MNETRVQLMTGLFLATGILALVGSQIFIGLKEQEKPQEYLWIVHKEAREMNQSGDVASNTRDMATRLAHACKPRQFQTYLDVSGLQSVFWKVEDVNKTTMDCLTSKSGGELELKLSESTRPSYIWTYH